MYCPACFLIFFIKKNNRISLAFAAKYYANLIHKKAKIRFNLAVVRHLDIILFVYKNLFTLNM